MKTRTATARDIRLIVETIITSHTGIAYHLEHNAQGTPHQGFNLLISVECTYRVTQKKTVITNKRITSKILFRLTQKTSATLGQASLCSRHLQSFKSVLQKLWFTGAQKMRSK